MKTNYRLGKTICKLHIPQNETYSEYTKNPWNSTIRKQTVHLKLVKWFEQTKRDTVGQKVHENICDLVSL